MTAQIATVASYLFQALEDIDDQAFRLAQLSLEAACKEAAQIENYDVVCRFDYLFHAIQDLAQQREFGDKQPYHVVAESSYYRAIFNDGYVTSMYGTPHMAHWRATERMIGRRMKYQLPIWFK